MRPTWAEINLDSVKRNFQLVEKMVGKDVKVLSVVKADAYGHGASQVSQALSQAGSELFGVATVEEAFELRESGINAPLFLLAGIQPEEARNVIEQDLIPCLFSLKTAQELDEHARNVGKKVKYHLKIDTGMSRLGTGKRDLGEVLSKLRDLDNLEMEGVLTHLASADKEKRDFTLKQISEFKEALALAREFGFRPKYFHLANSAGIQRFPEAHGNFVRPGIMLYGSGKLNGLDLKPVMKLKSRIIQLKKVPAGTPVSYGGTFVTVRPTVIATIPIGYADGYMRKLSNRARVSVNGTTAPVIGTICMDLTMIDVTEVPDVSVGDEVVLFGDGRISVEDVARWAETISYEILSRVGQRVHRVYV